MNLEEKEIQELTFDGIFQGREKEIRITPDRQISVFDFIKVVGGQKKPHQTWERIYNEHKDEVSSFWDHFKFKGTGQKDTPVINVQGMVKLLFWLPGETAKQFRSKSAETMIRYLGGDLTLIDEIKAIDQVHVDNPNNVAQVFREEVIENQRQQLLFTHDQLNISRKLLEHFADKHDILYGILFYRDAILYQKVGCVPVRKYHSRYKDHYADLGENQGEICTNFVFQIKDVAKVESEFKLSTFYALHNVELPKKNNEGNMTEIFKLSETLTSEMIKEKIMDIAGNRILDPPPRYTQIENGDLNMINLNMINLNIEKEKTKQKRIRKCKIYRRLYLNYSLKILYNC